jgi:hypothetical protein
VPPCLVLGRASAICPASGLRHVGWCFGHFQFDKWIGRQGSFACMLSASVINSQKRVTPVCLCMMYGIDMVWSLGQRDAYRSCVLLFAATCTTVAYSNCRKSVLAASCHLTV